MPNLHEQGELQHAQGRLSDAEASFRRLLALDPGDPFARLSLGVVLKDAGRAAESESLLAEGLALSTDPRLKAAYAYNLALAQYEHGHKQAALENFTLVRALEPARTSVELTRAGLLEELSRADEALGLLENLLQREPANDAAHTAYNDLIWRLGRDDEFLKSYDRAPPTTALGLGKAKFLVDARRGAEAHAAYADILLREPGNLDALRGAASALGMLGRHDEAVRLLEQMQARFAGDPLFHNSLAVAALQARDPQKSVAMAQRSLAAAPHDQHSLAVLGSAWRLLGDARDEALNGYDDLIQVFDLEPPEGFSSMADFNLELNAALDALHPGTREPTNQSLRSGSQTRGHIFGAGHDLVERLKPRIAQAVTRYIAGLKPDAHHPFRGRKAADFRFTGSWSSRLRDCGFHINHVHPEGWISSCYYVGVPEAVKDEQAREGWIKFGEPGFDIGLGIRRAIQPVPGRLVLFPSYMWHGTVPFHDRQPRTTIAFDAVPR